MSWRDQLRGDPLPWLLEPGDPGPRYLTLSRLLDAEDAELKSARRKAHREGEIAQVLSHLELEGYWVTPGPGYSPKYLSTVWSLILLAQLGAHVREDKRIAQACRYLLDQALARHGQITTLASLSPAGTADCLQGNILWALAELGYEDPRLELAHEWMARSLTGEGVAPPQETGAELRYYASGKSGPDFSCAANNKLPCAWGGVKVMLAFGNLPEEKRTPLIQRAIRRGVQFMLGIDPATAAYPTPYEGPPNRAWWKFGFPVFYITDLLQLAGALAALGYGNDRRLKGVMEFIRSKQDEQGRWPLEYDYPGKTWMDFGKKKEPNKWVTLRALQVLKSAAEA